MKRRAPLLLAVLLVASTGCDLVFGFDVPGREAPGDADAGMDADTYDRCAGQPQDDRLRYAPVVNPKVGLDGDGNERVLPWSWDEARTTCQLRGMDLAVFNDESELGRAGVGPGWPYWIGARIESAAWMTVDGCGAHVPPPASAGTACGIVRTALEIDATACDGVLPPPSEPAIVMGALCETPRPDDASCLGRDPHAATYTLSPSAMTYEAARQFCDDEGGRLVVVETHEEWLHLAMLTRTTYQQRFWIGSRLEGSTWKTVNGCPATYSWSNGTPGTPPDGSCLASVLRIESQDVDLVGVDPAACGDGEIRALCER